MCITPNRLADGELVACRKCWQCKENRINDWVGRCIAESRTAKAASVVTLTYGGGDHERAAVLTYSDLQGWFKRVRARGYPLKYLAAGEYGSLKGRAHWHVIVYWQDQVFPHMTRYGDAVGGWNGKELTFDWDGQERAYKLPKLVNSPVRCWDPIWPHGHCVWDIPDAAAVRYACKYLQKDERDDAKQYHLAMSKKPPLGSAYFDERAQRFIDQGLAPQDLFYTFDEARDRAGHKIQFKMAGVTADNFLRSYVDGWRARYGTWLPGSELVEDWLDKQEPERLDVQRARAVHKQERPWFVPALYRKEDIRFDEKRNAFYLPGFADNATMGEWVRGAAFGGERLYWSFDDEGDRSWQSVIRAERDKPLSSNRGAYRRLKGKGGNSE